MENILWFKKKFERKIKCNMCGNDLDFSDMQEDFTIKKDRLGYGTRYDGDSLEIHICCECMNKIIESCSISPVKELR